MSSGTRSLKDEIPHARGRGPLNPLDLQSTTKLDVFKVFRRHDKFQLLNIYNRAPLS